MSISTGGRVNPLVRDLSSNSIRWGPKHALGRNVIVSQIQEISSVNIQDTGEIRDATGPIQTARLCGEEVTRLLPAGMLAIAD